MQALRTIGFALENQQAQKVATSRIGARGILIEIRSACLARLTPVDPEASGSAASRIGDRNFAPCCHTIFFPPALNRSFRGIAELNGCQNLSGLRRVKTTMNDQAERRQRAVSRSRA